MAQAEKDNYSNKAPRGVLAHKLIWSEKQVIRIRIPQSATYKEIERKHDDGTSEVIKFWSYGIPVKGFGDKGRFINFFLRTDESNDFRGEEVAVRVDVKNKIMEDGSAYLFADMHLAIGEEPTRRMVMVQNTNAMPTFIKGSKVFKARHARGAIVFTALKGNEDSFVAEQSKVRKRPPSGSNPVLDDSIADILKQAIVVETDVQK